MNLKVCKDCNKCLKNEKSYNQHKKKYCKGYIQVKPIIICEKCKLDITNANYNNKTRHIKNCLGLVDLLCKYCNILYQKQKPFANHINNKHNGIFM
jgi:uncharacterized C2H2 Zn-finger protein